MNISLCLSFLCGLVCAFVFVWFVWLLLLFVSFDLIGIVITCEDRAERDRPYQRKKRLDWHCDDQLDCVSGPSLARILGSSSSQDGT